TNSEPRTLLNPIPDPTLHRYPLLDSHWPITTILVTYLLFTLKLGRKFMEHRAPYNLKNIMIVYNIIQVIYNTILFIYGIYYVFISPRYDRSCMTNLPYDHPEKNIERAVVYSFFINKYIDLLDTIFFVLRKSYKQITVLHVYHHVIMTYPFYWYIQIYGFGGQYLTMGFLNTFVHAVMYFYYFISSMYPELKGSLWWKKYITKLQIFQFILLLLQPIHVLIFNPGCKVPYFLHLLQMLVSASMITMFSKFYYRAYIKPRPQKP
ncbi:hypothetical protein KR044_000896, partial [Drosophila immigrans]